jgi:hypothetical protein
MTWHAIPLVVVAVLGGVACASRDLSLSGQPDAGPDGIEPTALDGRVDAPPDAPPLALAELCGAVPVTLDDWERCYEKRWCEWQVGCLPLNSYHDVQECIDESYQLEGGRLAAELRERLRAVQQARATLDVDAFTRCLRETSGELCNTARFSVACATRFIGKVADGGACYTDIECASSGASCEATCADACCAGTCRPKFREGEACDLGDSCEPGLVCHRTCLSGDIGAPCGSNRDCDSNAWCDAGRCRADLAPGATCTSPLQCGGQTSCVGLSIVDTTPGRCSSISKVGDRCDSFCYGNLFCDPSGVCRQLPELGQICSGFTPCRGIDTTCSNGRCVLLGGAGTACSNSQGCLPRLFCTSELNAPNPTCAPLGATGQRCVGPTQCESYRCSGRPGQVGVCLAWSESCLVDERDDAAAQAFHVGPVPDVTAAFGPR